MNKKLEEMSLAELWELFPIFLVEHNEQWKDWYREEESGILAMIPSGAIKRIAHVGSTAVETIWAKNIVDILVEVHAPEDLTAVEKILSENGWRCMYQGDDRISMNKGYTPSGFADRVFHLHIRLAGDNDELYFRDYLQEHPEVAEKYEGLKRSLWKKFEHDRDSYTESKTEFIKAVTERAKSEYKERYE